MSSLGSGAQRPKIEVDGPCVVRVGDDLYSWNEVRLSNAATKDWAHHGVIASPSGGFVSGTASGGGLFSSESGTLPTRLPTNESHGISLDLEGDPYTIWLADNGRKMVDAGSEGLQERTTPGRIVRVDLSGQVVQEIRDADLPAGFQGWRPCSVVSDHPGVDGRVYVADGYGLDLVHCFSRAGVHLWTTDGAESGRAFNTPHAVLVDGRGAEPRILIADRGNRRIVALSTDGKYLHAIADGELSSPSGLALDGDRLWVTELYGGVVVITNDQIVASFGVFNEPTEPMWPNANRNGQPARPPMVSGTFRSPHGIAAAPDGRIAITEWVIGGRLIILEPVDARNAHRAVHRSLVDRYRSSHTE